MSSNRSHASDGDWHCESESCGNVNFARRTHCNRCGGVKSVQKAKDVGVPIGKHMAEKSHGLFSAEDWQCKTCGNVNWARRGECNVCKMPKKGKVESRTGYGGGFNEREGVEYKDASKTEDIYDEFGRKRKRYTKPTESTPPPPEVSARREQDASKKDDVDDDDEEDDDLDAYNLDSDEEEYEQSKKPEATIVLKSSKSSSVSSKSRSRSRSRSRRSSSSSSTSSSSKRPSKSQSHSSSRSSRSRSSSGDSDTRSGKRKRYASPSRSRSHSVSSTDQWSGHKKKR